MHSSLERQLKKVFGSLEKVPSDLKPLLDMVSETYAHYEEEKIQNERSLDLSSKELTATNEKLKKETQISRVQTDQLALQVQELERVRAGILNVLEDMEEEKKKVDLIVVQRTKELTEEKARLLASINSLSFGFILADLQHTILLKNSALMHILDLQGDPKTIHDISKSFDTPDIHSVKFDLVESCKQCIDLKQTLEIKEVSYGQKYLRVFCAPISTEGVEVSDMSSKNVIGYVFLVEDITEARIMDRSREEFFAVASHELRTPLTAIRGNADMMLDLYADKIPDKDMKEMLQDIDTSSIRLIDIVNDFLEVSRLEQGRVKVKKEILAIDEVIEKTLREFKDMTEKKGLFLHYSPHTPALPLVLADRDRVEQILINLVGNATKFTKEGGITIGVEQIGNFLKIQVIDTGIGISEHNQALLFRKFQQAGEQILARDVTQGTGLGLYICRHLISYMGGTIGLEHSELGKGSTFTFTLPLAA